MSWWRFLGRSLAFHWPSNLVVALGCAVAASVLTGALLVGDSMRGSLRAMTLERLGAIESVVVTPRFFPVSLSKRLESEGGLPSDSIATVLFLRGSVAAQRTDGPGPPTRRVQIVGTTTAFWRLFPEIGDPEKLARQTLVNAELADLLEAKEGQTVVAQLEAGSAVPREGLMGERDEIVRQVPFVVDRVIPVSGVGRFSLEASQRTPRTLFVPIERLSRAIEQGGRGNALLSRVENLEPLLDKTMTLDDLGYRLVKSAKFDFIAVEPARQIMESTEAETIVAAATKVGASSQRVMTYLANTIAVGDREVPYSIVTAIDFPLAAPLGPIPTEPAAMELKEGEILLNQWTVDQLGAKIGDAVRLGYYRVEDSGLLSTASHSFRLAGVVKMDGLGVDQGFTPDYPGITNAKDFSDWSPPFAIDLKRIRPVDDDYWKKYKTAPKAFLRLSDGQRIWGSRFGDVTSVRVGKPETSAAAMATELEPVLRGNLEPASEGFVPYAVRTQDLAASSGSTDFSMLFLSFSFFLIIAAGLLVAILFRLNVERRAAQFGVLLAVGLNIKRVRRLLLAEGLFVAAAGSSLGMLGAVGYAKVMIALLTSWWQSAVNTPFIEFHAGPLSFVIGWCVSIAIAGSAIAWSAWQLKRASATRLMAPGFTFAALQPLGAISPWTRRLAIGGLAGGGGILAIEPAVTPNSPVGFFIAAFLLLIGSLAALAGWLRRRPVELMVSGRGTAALTRLGFRNASRYPSRSVLTASLLALATFVVVAVGALRHSEVATEPSFNSGDGGFALVARTDSPVLLDVGDAKAREDLGFSDAAEKALKDATIFGFRMRGGDDASCLNIYRPRNPTLLGATKDFIERGGFAFALSLAESEGERYSPWALLDRTFEDGAIPAIGDEAALTWILKQKVGSTLEITDEMGRPLKLRIVAGLSGSIFQGELLISEANLLKAFPSVAGDRYFLVAAPPAEVKAVGATLAAGLSRYGWDATSTAQRIAEFKAVENTYMAAFQTLGGLGLVLGTLGLATVLFRNILERRGELGLLRAVGFRRSAIGWLVMAENEFLLLAGIGIGAGCALIAVAPQLLRAAGGLLGGAEAIGSIAGTLGLVLLIGTASGLLAIYAALRTPLLQALRRE